jgi:hypothetical protein
VLILLQDQKVTAKRANVDMRLGDHFVGRVLVAKSDMLLIFKGFQSILDGSASGDTGLRQNGLRGYDTNVMFHRKVR